MQETRKKVAGYIFLLNKKIVSSKDRKTVISDDPVSYAGSISDNGADEIIVFDMSVNINNSPYICIIVLMCNIFLINTLINRLL